jgi:hypothetical protein
MKIDHLRHHLLALPCRAAYPLPLPDKPSRMKTVSTATVIRKCVSGKTSNNEIAGKGKIVP